MGYFVPGNWTFLVFITDHLNLLMYQVEAKSKAVMATALKPANLRSSCSGLALQARNVVTSNTTLFGAKLLVGNDSLKMLRVLLANSCTRQKEGASTFGHLGHSSRSSILILKHSITQRGRHANHSTWEVGVVVQTLSHLDAGRSGPVTCMSQSEDDD